jgi:hypothetical protein
MAALQPEVDIRARRSCRTVAMKAAMSEIGKLLRLQRFADWNALAG